MAILSIKMASQDTRKSGTVIQVVINNPNEDDRHACANPPAWVKSFTYQDEVAPTTGTLHVNGCLKTKYTVDILKLKKWLARANFKFAQSLKHAQHIEEYAHKDETAVAGTQQEVVDPGSTAHKVCLLLASKVIDIYKQVEWHDKPKSLYNIAMNKILAEDMTMAGRLMNPSLRNFWIDTRYTWFDHIRKQAESP